MAKNNLKKTIDSWADAAIDDPVRRIWFICTGAGLLIVGFLMALLSNGNETKYITTVNPITGAVNTSIQGPSVFAVLVFYIGIAAGGVGLVMAVAIGIRLYKRWTDGGGSPSRPGMASGAALASTWTPGPGPASAARPTATYAPLPSAAQTPGQRRTGSSMVCPQCGFWPRPGETTCDNCGTPLPEETIAANVNSYPI